MTTAGSGEVTEESWEVFRAQAEQAGLNRIWVLDREAVDAAFAPISPVALNTKPVPASDTTQPSIVPPPGVSLPSSLHPEYRRAVVLGSGGRTFWERFQASLQTGEATVDHPLDRYTEQVVEALRTRVHTWDAHAVTAYPFRHPRQLMGFQRLVTGTPPRLTTPFGLTLDPVYGPWLAWRAVLFTGLGWPVSSPPRTLPCADCPAPCTAVCPARAARKEGFDWVRCGDFRLEAPTCRETCLARLACPVGATHRYGPEQLRYHYRSSLAEIRRYREAAQ